MASTPAASPSRSSVVPSASVPSPSASEVAAPLSCRRAVRRRVGARGDLRCAGRDLRSAGGQGVDLFDGVLHGVATPAQLIGDRIELGEDRVDLLLVEPLLGQCRGDVGAHLWQRVGGGLHGGAGAIGVAGDRLGARRDLLGAVRDLMRTGGECRRAGRESAGTVLELLRAV